jgi:hypothetical protein
MAVKLSALRTGRPLFLVLTSVENTRPPFYLPLDWVLCSIISNIKRTSDTFFPRWKIEVRLICEERAPLYLVSWNPHSKTGRILNSRASYIRSNTVFSADLQYDISRKPNSIICIVPCWRYLLGYNRLSHLIVHTFYSPTTVGVTIAQLQSQELSNSQRLSFLEASWSLAAQLPNNLYVLSPWRLAWN